MDFQELRGKDVGDARAAIRASAYTGHTAGLGAGLLQTNLAIMPASFARHFEEFAAQNPKPCPLAGISEVGSPQVPLLGSDIDLRSDVPAYNIYRFGELASSVTDISDIWRDDFVAFAIGCSFTFEHALCQAGISLWHIDHDKTVPMYRTNVALKEVGPFRGNMVVSMRMIKHAQVEQATTISERYPLAHGGPVHVGEPGLIGIADLSAPDWGDRPPTEGGKVPVFWACGVTPQIAIEQAGIDICITHKPGHMLITDVPEDIDPKRLLMGNAQSQ